MADGGACFAVWKMPYNHQEEKNTPLAVYLGDGSPLRVFPLFEIFDRQALAEDIERASGLVCPPHLYVPVEIKLQSGRVDVRLRGRVRSLPVLSLDVLPLLLCETSEEEARARVEILASDDPERRE